LRASSTLQHLPPDVVASARSCSVAEEPAVPSGVVVTAASWGETVRATVRETARGT
jgi:hypothetical protein